MKTWFKYLVSVAWMPLKSTLTRTSLVLPWFQRRFRFIVQRWEWSIRAASSVAETSSYCVNICLWSFPKSGNEAQRINKTKQNIINKGILYILNLKFKILHLTWYIWVDFISFISISELALANEAGMAPLSCFTCINQKKCFTLSYKHKICNGVAGCVSRLVWCENTGDNILLKVLKNESGNLWNF